MHFAYFQIVEPFQKSLQYYAFPAVLIRTSTERPEVLDKGTIVIGGINEKDVIQSIEICRTKSMLLEQSALPADYEDINISIKVVKIIQSYTKLINEFVWRKN